MPTYHRSGRAVDADGVQERVQPIQGIDDQGLLQQALPADLDHSTVQFHRPGDLSPGAGQDTNSKGPSVRRHPVDAVATLPRRKDVGHAQIAGEARHVEGDAGGQGAALDSVLPIGDE
jgi:hypothetical protein